MSHIAAPVESALPADWRSALLLGRIDIGDGPTPVLIRNGEVFDMSRVAPTVSALIAGGRYDTAAGTPLGPLDALALSAALDAPARLLSPIDLHCVKAAGVTFAVSAIEPPGSSGPTRTPRPWRARHSA